MAAALRLAFMGSPDFAVPALQALHDAGHRIAAVYCQPPRPAGRGHAIRPCPVQVRAQSLGLPVRTPARLRTNTEEHAAFAALDLDAAVVAAYGLIIPPPMLAAPRRGCINIHASLLPRWRGAAPIQAAILAGDAVSGVTDHANGCGPRYRADTAPRRSADHAAHDRKRTARCTGHDRPGTGAARARRSTRACAAARGERHLRREAHPRKRPDRLDARATVAWIGRCERSIPGRAPSPPSPPAPSKILAAEPVPGHGDPGTCWTARSRWPAGAARCAWTGVQAPGGAAMDAASFLRGHPMPAGTRLG